MKKLTNEKVGVSRKLRNQHVIALSLSAIVGILFVIATGAGLEMVKQFFFVKEKVEVIHSVAINTPTEVIKLPPTVELRQEDVLDLLISSESVVDFNLKLPEESPSIEIEVVDTSDFELDFLVDEVITDRVDGAFSSLPNISSRRCTREDRLARIQELEGLSESEDAIEAALLYLVETQNSDGSWSRGADMSRVSLTGLSVLAFLGRCETPVSVNKSYRECVKTALDFLVSKSIQYEGNIVSNGKKVHESAYVQAVMAYALCESYTFCDAVGYTGVEGLEEAVTYSVSAIIKGQNDNGGWIYEYGEGGGDRSESDSSIVGWNLQALKAAKLTGRHWHGLDDAIKKGLDVMLLHQESSGGIKYRLSGKKSSLGLTMAGVLALQQHQGDVSAISKGIEHFSQNVRPLNYELGGKEANIYEHYYASQVMVNVGGEAWREYRDLYLLPTLDNQLPDGSFKIPNQPTLMGGYRDGIKGRVYTTTVSILMLEVFYRFLPTAQLVSLNEP